VEELTQAPLSRRGKTLEVARLTIEFADGTQEVWHFPPGAEPARYRQGGNRQTKPEQSWVTHELWWQSDKMVNGTLPPPALNPGDPIVDDHGRATGFVA
jgi:hypothetical protein